MEVRPLNFQRGDEIIISSPLEGGWVEVVGGRRLEFPQFAQFKVSTNDANYLLERAANAKRCRDEQRVYERQEWARSISSLNQRTRDMALKFCDVEGNPRSPEIPMLPLVNLSLPEGQAIYKQAWDKAKAEGKVDAKFKKQLHAVEVVRAYDPDPDLGDITQGESQRFRQEAYEASERVPTIAEVAAPPATVTAQVEGEEAPNRPVVIKKPSASWSESDLVKYAQSKGFTVSKADLKVEGRLLDIALRAHADHCGRLRAAGIQYEEG